MQFFCFVFVFQKKEKKEYDSVSLCTPPFFAPPLFPGSTRCCFRFVGRNNKKELVNSAFLTRSSLLALSSTAQSVIC